MESETNATTSSSEGSLTNSEAVSNVWEKKDKNWNKKDKKAKDEDESKEVTNLNDSVNWPILDTAKGNSENIVEVAATKLTTSSSPSRLTPSGSHDDIANAVGASVAAEAGTPSTGNSPSLPTDCAENHRRVLESGGEGEDSASPKNSGPENKKPGSKKRGSKQKWKSLEIELPKTERKRRGGGGGAGHPRNENWEHDKQTKDYDRPIRDHERPIRDHERPIRDGDRPNRERFRPPANHEKERSQDNNRSYASGRDLERSKRSQKEGGGRDKSNEVNTNEMTTTTTNATTTASSQQPRKERGGYHSRSWREQHEGNERGGIGTQSGRGGYRGSRRGQRGRSYGADYINHQNPYYQPQFYDQDPVYVNTVAYPTVPMYTATTTTYYYEDSIVKTQLRQQIEYYFSDVNLSRDFFMRRKMTKEGWVSIDLIASFHRVATLAQDHSVILEAMINSEAVEISPDSKSMRTKMEPEKWPIEGTDPTSFSHLKPDVPEFVPGKRYVAVPQMIEEANDEAAQNLPLSPDGNSLPADDDSTSLESSSAHLKMDEKEMKEEDEEKEDEMKKEAEEEEVKSSLPITTDEINLPSSSSNTETTTIVLPTISSSSSSSPPITTTTTSSSSSSPSRSSSFAAQQASDPQNSVISSTTTHDHQSASSSSSSFEHSV